MNRIAATGVLIGCLLATGCAQAALKGSGDVVKVAPAAAAVAAAPGQRVQFAVELDIAKPWHLYAHGDTNFIGVDLDGAETFPLAELKAEYPAGKAKEFFGDMVMMIEGRQTIKASALVPASLTKGRHDLPLLVMVQACDDKTCLAPARVPVSVTLEVK